VLVLDCAAAHDPPNAQDKEPRSVENLKSLRLAVLVSHLPTRAAVGLGCHDRSVKPTTWRTRWGGWPSATAAHRPRRGTPLPQPKAAAAGGTLAGGAALAAGSAGARPLPARGTSHVSSWSATQWAG
jgi:hypothetical protein